MENILARKPSFALSKFYKFDEITLYLINLVLACLFLADPVMRLDLVNLVITDEGGKSVLILLFCCYAFFSVFRMVLSPDKNDGHKSAVGFYVVLVNLFVGSVAIDYLNSNDSGILDYIFPAFNLSLALLVMLALRAGVAKSEEIITDKQARGIELLVGIITVPLLVFVIVAPKCDHWTIAFSACLFYAVFINRIVAGLLPGKTIAVPEVK